MWFSVFPNGQRLNLPHSLRCENLRENFPEPLLGKNIRRWGGDGALRKEAKDSVRGRAGTCVLTERG